MPRGRTLLSRDLAANVVPSKAVLSELWFRTGALHNTRPVCFIVMSKPKSQPSRGSRPLGPRQPQACTSTFARVQHKVVSCSSQADLFNMHMNWTNAPKHVPRLMRLCG